jgi:hypothetical protein
MSKFFVGKKIKNKDGDIWVITKIFPQNIQVKNIITEKVKWIKKSEIAKSLVGK